MKYGYKGTVLSGSRVMVIVMAACWIAASGCQELETLKKEVLKATQVKVLKPKAPFIPRDGITTRGCSLYQTANPNSEVMRKLPAETPVQLVDKVGEYYRVRTRDGREGFVEHKVVGGQEVILRTQELRQSIEGMPVQAEGVTKTKANFRLYAGREHEVIEVLPPDKRFEVFERIVTIRPTPARERSVTRGARPADGAVAAESCPPDEASEDTKKDVWYKVKIEDGRVGYLYTHNMTLVPPEDIARAVPFMRIVAWRRINVTDDPDLGAKSNYLAAYAPIGRDPGCDFTKLYMISWSPKLKARTISWQQRVDGILPISNFQSEGRPGFSVRTLHPVRSDKLVLANFVLLKGQVRRVGEEEIANTGEIH